MKTIKAKSAVVRDRIHRFRKLLMTSSAPSADGCTMVGASCGGGADDDVAVWDLPSMSALCMA
eukprot:1043953-Amphidinium_carterae.1